MNKCKNCNESISPKRLALVPHAALCVQCKSEQDDFKWRMKTVGFNDSPTIAKTERSWKVLSKQKQARDI